MIGRLLRDIRYGTRSLARTPVLTGAAVLSIALGIAASTSVFSIVDAALFRPPPLDRPGELAMVFMTRQAVNRPPERVRWSWQRFQLLARDNRSFEQVATFSVNVYAITSGEAEPTNAEVVSASYLPILHVRPVLGRAFTQDEDAHASPIVLIGWELWQRRFGGKSDAIGSVISVNSVPLTIVGVLPENFHGLTGRAELWVPPATAARLSYAEYLTTNQNFISVVGRLRPGVTIEQARTELAVLGRDIDRAIPSAPDEPELTFSAVALTLNEARVDPTTRNPLLLLLGGTACLLVLACVNVAGLLLGRAASRRREIAIRIATGASRGRIVSQLLAEAALLATAGGVLGVIIAVPATVRFALPAPLWGSRNFYGALGEFSVPSVDVRVIAFAIAVCAVATVAFGLAPALQASPVDLTRALKDGGGGGRAGGRSRIDPRRLLVGTETSLAMVLLAAGGLLAAGWHRLERSNIGFDRSHLLTFLVRPSEVRYPPAKAPALLSRVLAELERLPSVEAASVDGCAPISTGCANTTLYIIGRPAPAPNEAPGVLRHYVAPNHFRTLGVPLLRGRTFDERDRQGGHRVAIINQLAARRFWPNEDPIGKRVWFGGGSSFDSPDSSAEIVGIVGDVAYQSLDQRPFQPDFYTPYTQFTYATRTVLVRTTGEPLAALADVRRAVASVDPSLALFEVRTMDQVADDSWARLSYQTRMLGAFAFVAVLLAATGVFAIVAHVIGDRRREIGIRVALGATPVQVLTAVSESGTRPAVIGLLVGAALTAAVGKGLSSAVFGVPAFDPAVIGAVVVLLTIVIAAAAYAAARKALTVDPVESLRLE